MEIKDLVLLLAIPITLVMILLYLGDSAITGAAVAQESKNKIIGTYSINPSFKAAFKYDLNDYSKIKSTFDAVLKCSQEGNELQSCIDSADKAGFEWSLGCDKGPEKVLYDLAELLQDCFDSDDSNCVCKKNMDISKDEILKYELPKKEFRIAVSQDIPLNKIIMQLSQPKSSLKYEVKLNGRSLWYPSLYVVSYADDSLIGINMFFTDELSGERKALGPLKEIVLYKNEMNGIKFIDFVKQENNNLVYPNNDVKKLDNVRPCNLKPKNIYRFCATKKDYKITAYDEMDGLVKERPLTIKFASYIPDLAPAPLTGLEVFDAPKAEKLVIVKWDKSLAKDVAKYKIYFTEKPDLLDKTSTDQLRKDPEVFVDEIGLATAKTEDLEDSIITNECEFDFQNKKCIFTTSNGEKKFIEKGKFYYIKSANSYLYMLPVKEDKAYDFGMTAVDSTNNELDNVGEKQKMPVSKSLNSIDDMPPDSSIKYLVNDAGQNIYTLNIVNTNSKNIDDSILEVKDFGAYKVYYRKYAKLATLEEELIASDKLRDSKLNELKNAQVIESNQNLIKIDISLENPQTENAFQFIVIATDLNGNPKEDQFKVKELGAVPVKVVIS